MHRYMHTFGAGWWFGVGGGRDRAVGSSKIHEPWPGVVDLNKEVAFVITRGKNDIPFNIRSNVCVFQNPLFFDRV